MHIYGCSNDGKPSSRQLRALQSLQVALNALPTERSEQEATQNTASTALLGGSGIFSILSPQEIALAAIMMQTKSVTMTGIGVVEVHMRCALQFVRDLGLLRAQPKSEFLRLLIFRFAMVDVLLSLVRFRRPMAPVDFFMFQPNDHLDRDDPSFRELQGCSQRVLCFLARISNLSADLLAGSDSQPEIQRKAYSLDAEMREWGHRYFNGMLTPDPDGLMWPQPPMERDYLEVVCECFYWTAHLLLLRRVFLDPTRSARVQLIRSHMFQLMDRLPAGCGPDSSLSFPFYMAAREAVAQEDRDWARRKHAAMMEAYRERPREAFMRLTERIWATTVTEDPPTFHNTHAWETSHEKFIRGLDREAEHFVF